MSIQESPIGSPQDPVFSYQDLIKVGQEFVTDGAYFGNGNHTVICKPPLHGSLPECAIEAVLWINPQYIAPNPPAWHTIYTYVEPPPNNHPVVTPEPPYNIWLLVLIMAVLACFKRLRIA